MFPAPKKGPNRQIHSCCAASDGFQLSDVDHLATCHPLANAKAEQKYLARQIHGEELTLWADEKTWAAPVSQKPTLDELTSLLTEEETGAIYLFAESPNGDCWTFVVTSEFSYLFAEYQGSAT